IHDDGIKGLEALAGSDHPLFNRSHHPLADAWFLDGFDPAKNPDLWCQPLFELMARLSKPGTTVSAFTVAKSVVEGLKEAGFVVSKPQAQGTRETIVRAQFNEPEKPPYEASSCKSTLKHRRNAAFAPPWYLPPIYRGE